MKNMRLPLIIALGVAIIGIVFGSFFDLQISTAIANPNNGFGLAVSAVGPMLGFAGVAAMGGGFIAFILKGKYHVALKVLFGVLAAACFGVAIFYPAGEWFGVNGFYGAAPEWVGYLVVIIPEAAAAVGGYFLFKEYKNDKLWIVFCIIIVLLLIALLAVIPTIKDNMHRPRYRYGVRTGFVDFHNWWQPFKEYKTQKDLYVSSKEHPIFIEGWEMTKDEYKSFPSGHTAEASILLTIITFLPLADESFKKYQMPLFYGACGLVVLVAFARILVGAHYLSDVSTGATVILALLIIANEVVMRVKALHYEEQETPKK